jgi:protein-L-isoaspartate(D-aspartate) O-methyltransferase
MARARGGSDPVQSLIAELRRAGIVDERVLWAIASVPRNRFVPAGNQEHAWANVALPIGEGQTISQPYIVALMASALKPRGDESVLEVGTGSGYGAAVLARLARQVTSIERHESLALAAQARLEALGIANVRIHVADGTQGWPAGAPYDGIVVTAGAPAAPPLLVEQLAPGGRLVIPIGPLGDQRLVAIERRGDSQVVTDLGPVRFVPLIGEGGWPEGIEDERDD